MTISSPLPTVVTEEHKRVLVVGKEEETISPAAAFRNQYYQQQQQKSQQNTTVLQRLTEDEQHQPEGEQDDFMCRPGAIVYAPLNTTPSSSIIDIYAESEEDEQGVIFEPEKSSSEPKIIVDRDSNHRSSSKLLSKLSKSTAPMRAKLSKTNLDHLWVNSSTTLTLPLRKSAESVHHMSLSRKKKKSKIERPQSFSFESSSPTATVSNEVSQRHIYPALLSKVAYAFKENMVVGTKSKDSIQYHDVFDGRDAVNKLTSIIKTSDRNLAILVGRALDHQKFFHDVNYERRLRDSANELYQFRQNLNNKRPKRKLSADSDTIIPECSPIEAERVQLEETDFLPNGIFTILTDCYSPTCTTQNSCYTVLCPRRLIQPNQSSLSDENEDRLWKNTVSESILKELSDKEKRRQENIYELIYTEKDFVEDLLYVENNWIEPLAGHKCLPGSEEFIKDVFWNLSEIRQSNSLLLDDLLQRQQAHKVVHQIGDMFLKHVSIFEPFIAYGSHQVISKYIFETEKSTNPAFSKLVEAIERAPESRKLELNGYLTKPTTRLGRYNLLLREILKHTPNDHPDCKAIPLVMEAINKYLERVNEESGKTENRFSLELLEKKLTNYKKSFHQEIEDLDLLADDRRIIVKGALKRKSSVNASSESSELQIYVLDHCLLVIKSKYIDNIEHFKLNRKPIPLILLAIALPDQSKRSSSVLQYNRSSTGSFYSSGSADLPPPPVISYSSSTSFSTSGKSGYPISFIHLGRQGSGTLTLYASTFASRRKWVDTIERYRHSIMEKSKVFHMAEISDQYFNSFNKVNCVAKYKDSLMMGCGHGIYVKKPLKQNMEEDDEDEDIVRILSMAKVSQIDVLEGLKLIIILAEKNLYTYSLDSVFDENNQLIASIPTSPLKSIKENSIRSCSTDSSTHTMTEDTHKLPFMKSPKTNKGALRKLSSNVSFFKVGQVFDKSSGVERTLLCYVRYNAITSTIRALEPYIEEDGKKKKKRKGPHLFIRNTTDVLRGFKDLYIPGEATSIQYFRNVICVGSAKGFQMVDIGSAGVQSVLDPNDKNNDFVGQRETLRPISMFRHPDGCILLCYNEIAFYIDKKGRRVRSDWIVNWEGHPTAFAFYYPYILAFDSSFIEIRHMNTGDLIQVIPGNNIRCLRPDPTDEIYCVMEERSTGNEMVLSLRHAKYG